MSAISIRQVAKSYAKSAVVHGVDLEIASGEFVVILGPSGCGKSTLLRMIAGLEAITAGEIAIEDRVVNKLEPRERGCAMVFQNYALYPHMSVAENIGYALKVAGVAKTERRRRVEAVAATVGLTETLDRKPAALSGGQRQRVAMGRAMIREPKIFLFDEPLSNLDALLRVGMRAEIRRLHRRLGTTSVFVTHDQVEAMTLADRLVVMRAGRIEQVGTPAEVYDRPATRFVASFIGAPPMNLLEGELEPDDAFRLAGGGRLALRAGERVRFGARRVTIGIRPEHTILTRRGAPGSLDAVVEFVEELGASRVVYADVGAGASAIVAAVVADATPVATGDPVGLLLPADRLHAFDAETGARVETAPIPARQAA
ncbi:sn-glycerol-3-phosphate ABC transporter ATP-binding protein UgpC [Aureimonas pseudogalii]|uniref:sn-glycerol 3-phosphate transport system ATP-binding protein n=1 Tax=Aureimonas pseudogalii TaxID=1744844 RepID=A0A7W6H449_9HYPH|nr:sn-glycerol-3-phosphate ABC transporter ATP-binding protein UgpC [Aureimonas pseudogalii]MBB3996604.1 sn-glycerol 3-phosphate transport system ATP-binding protein [Aureimonas pseudogalii]